MLAEEYVPKSRTEYPDSDNFSLINSFNSYPPWSHPSAKVFVLSTIVHKYYFVIFPEVKHPVGSLSYLTTYIKTQKYIQKQGVSLSGE